MEHSTDAIGNPTALLIERFFWLGLGVFLAIAIINSFLKGIKVRTNKMKPVKPFDLEKLAKKATQQNSSSN